jgi:AmmeMemoRadiSam system protein A
MSIINAVMVPHPPIIIPEVGRGEERKIQATADAYLAAAKFVADARPETIVVTTPHSVMYADWFHISPGASASGSFAQFGAGSVKISAGYDAELRDEICRLAREAGFPAGTDGERDRALDHATMIPLYFLKKAYGDTPLPPIVRVGLSGLPLEKHYALGMMIRAAAEKLGRRVSVVASGDLSHRLRSDGPYGFNPAGPKYDERIMDVMGRADFGGLFSFGEAFCDEAGECGHRSFTIMAGCFDGAAVKAERLSHEDTFGVGYGVCLFTPEMPDGNRHFLAEAEARESARLAERKKNEDGYVRLARLSVETYVKTGKRAELPDGLPEDMTRRRAGAFVSLHMDGQLRGCIGTISATTDSVAREILQNGVSACSRDPRFAPVTEKELPYLEYSVDVLGDAEDVASPEELDAKRYGVIVENGGRRGLLLPDLDGVDTPEQQIAIAKRKAGIGERERVSLQRFEVVRHV